LIQPLFGVQHREIVKDGGHIGMIITQESLKQGEGIVVEGFGLAVAALRSIEYREMVEGMGHIRMIVAQKLFPQRQGLVDQRFRLAVAALRLIQTCKIVEAGGHIRMVVAEAILGLGEGQFKPILSVMEGSLAVVKQRDFVYWREDIAIGNKLGPGYGDFFKVGNQRRLG